MKVVPIISGGLDSITLLYYLRDQGHTVERTVSFNYGQRHKKELTFAIRHAKKIGAIPTLIDLSQSGLADVFSRSGSSLTDSSVDVPEGHYAAENMSATVVPNRNMMMLSIAGAIAVSDEADQVATAVHAGDHFIYPDCRPVFIEAASDALYLGNVGFGAKGGTTIVAPFSKWTKADIAEKAIYLGVPLEETWSCYKGGAVHCGRCGTCVERLEAIDEAIKAVGTTHDVDLTVYEDDEYWKLALKEGV